VFGERVKSHAIVPIAPLNLDTAFMCQTTPSITPRSVLQFDVICPRVPATEQRNATTTLDSNATALKACNRRPIVDYGLEKKCCDHPYRARALITLRAQRPHHERTRALSSIYRPRRVVLLMKSPFELSRPRGSVPVEFAAILPEIIVNGS
jgi:hypothetical protein